MVASGTNSKLLETINCVGFCYQKKMHSSTTPFSVPIWCFTRIDWTSFDNNLILGLFFVLGQSWLAIFSFVSLRSRFYKNGHSINNRHWAEVLNLKSCPLPTDIMHMRNTKNKKKNIRKMCFVTISAKFLFVQYFERSFGATRNGPKRLALKSIKRWIKKNDVYQASGRNDKKKLQKFY